MALYIACEVLAAGGFGVFKELDQLRYLQSFCCHECCVLYKFFSTFTTCFFLPIMSVLLSTSQQPLRPSHPQSASLAECP